MGNLGYLLCSVLYFAIQLNWQPDTYTYSYSGFSGTGCNYPNYPI